MVVFAVGMTVGDFFSGGRADFGHFAFKTQLHAGQRVVAVYHGFAIGDVGYAGNPGVSGVAVAERIRGISDVPIMMITALSDEPDRIRGLEAGADDYVTKPFSPRELTLRAQALVRRWHGRHSPALSNGDLVIDTASHRVYLHGSVLDMSDTEVRFLEVLARNIGHVVTYADLLSQVWGTEDHSGGKDMIKTTAYRVRRSLGEAGRRYIHSVRGEGYTMPHLAESTSGDAAGPQPAAVTRTAPRW